MSRTPRIRGAVSILLALTLGAAGCGNGDRTVSPPAATSSGPAGSFPGTPAASPTAPPSPDDAVIPAPPDNFYAVPDPLPPGLPGDLIWGQRVAAPRGAVSWRVLYRSETIRGGRIAVSGLVVAPDRPAPPGGFPVIGWAHGTTGLSDGCAPSREVRPIDGAEDGGASAIGSLPLPPLWEQGFVVAATDYEGLGTPGRHPYLVGGSEGRSVLDAIRAAGEILGAHAGGPAFILGVSQGGHAALFAGELAGAYAPEVDLRGVVALAPASELAQAALLFGNEEGSVGFAVAIAAGFAAAYPQADLKTILTPDALRGLDVVDHGCIDDVLQAFARPVREVVRLDRIVAPPWPALLEENTPGRAPIPAPVFVGQGSADPLVVPALTDLLVERLCDAGNQVTYRRYPGAGHGGVAMAAEADVEAWIRDRLAGRAPAAEGCPG